MEGLILRKQPTQSVDSITLMSYRNYFEYISNQALATPTCEIEFRVPEFNQ